MLRIGRNISRIARLMALVVTPLFVFESTASAQVTVGPAGAQLGSAEMLEVELHADATRRSHDTFQPIRNSLNTIDYGRIASQRVPGGSVQTAASGRKRSVMRSVLGGALGAAGGFFAGAYLGAFIEGDRCHCDDPGLKGALIGAPVGAVTGGILGAKFF